VTQAALDLVGKMEEIELSQSNNFPLKKEKERKRTEAKREEKDRVKINEKFTNRCHRQT
jgi:hypothetical protein